MDPNSNFSNPPAAVSIIIPVYNREAIIKNCLNSLFKLSNKWIFEIIVVDSSNDNTADVIKKNFPEVILIKQEQQTFPGDARNIGVKNASGEIIAFIDSDCRARENWLINGIKRINEDYDIVGGQVLNGNPKSLISRADYLLSFKDFLPGNKRGEVDFLPTCNLICKRSDFNEIGGFSANLPLAEDTVFCYKAKKKKLKILYDPEVSIHHYNRTKFGEYLSHHYNFGKYLGLINPRIDNKSALFLKIKPLLIFIPLIKILRIYFKILIFNPRQFPAFLLFFPLIIPGIFAWSLGFIRAVLKKNETQINF